MCFFLLTLKKQAKRLQILYAKEIEEINVFYYLKTLQQTSR